MALFRRGKSASIGPATGDHILVRWPTKVPESETPKVDISIMETLTAGSSYGKFKRTNAKMSAADIHELQAVLVEALRDLEAMR